MKAVEVIQVIKTELDLRGDGTKESPMRRVTQYWDFDGKLLWEHDIWEEKQKLEDGGNAEYNETIRY